MGIVWNRISNFWEREELEESGILEKAQGPYRAFDDDDDDDDGDYDGWQEDGF
jgi:hypothetical protein